MTLPEVTNLHTEPFADKNVSQTTADTCQLFTPYSTFFLTTQTYLFNAATKNTSHIHNTCHKSIFLDIKPSWNHKRDVSKRFSATIEIPTVAGRCDAPRPLFAQGGGWETVWQPTDTPYEDFNWFFSAPGSRGFITYESFIAPPSRVWGSWGF